LGYLLDTNIIIYAINEMPSVLEKLVAHDGELLTSAINLVELQRGIWKEPAYAALRRARLSELLRNILVLPFDTAAAEAYGEILGVRGWVRGQDFDRMIAGHAISARAVLVTNNARDFEDIPRLLIENWASL
jgi:predicted nucleic acid-binding protein